MWSMHYEGSLSLEEEQTLPVPYNKCVVDLFYWNQSNWLQLNQN